MFPRLLGTSPFFFRTCENSAFCRKKKRIFQAGGAYPSLRAPDCGIRGSFRNLPFSPC